MANLVFTYSAPAGGAITVNDVGQQQRNGDVILDADITSADAAVEMLISLASTAKPAASLFGASSGGDPSDGTGTGYLDGGTIELPTSGPLLYFDLPDGLTLASYKIWLLPNGGGDSDVAEVGPVTLDTKAPELSSTTPANGATGVSTTANVVLNFDEIVRRGAGTLTLWNQTDGTAISDIALQAEDGNRTPYYGTNNWRLSMVTEDTTMTIYPISSGAMPSGKVITVRWTAGTFEDKFGNPIALNNSTPLFSFTTA